MKVVVQIPCLNEELTLPLVLASIPTTIPGVDEIEILVPIEFVMRPGL